MRHAPLFDGTRVQWETPDKQALAFGWEGPLTVDGIAQDWDHFPHYSNRYTQTAINADEMTIHCDGGEALTLNFAPVDRN